MEQPWWRKILSSGLVWGAFIAWGNGLVLVLWPTVPQNMIALTNGLMGAILAAVGIGVTIPAVRKFVAKFARK